MPPWPYIQRQYDFPQPAIRRLAYNITLYTANLVLGTFVSLSQQKT